MSANFDSWEEEITNTRFLKRGDQIAVDGEQAGMAYKHHGIYIGHKKVVDVGPDTPVRKIKLEEFTDSGNRTLHRINYPSNQCLSNKEVAGHAEYFAKNPSRWHGYNLVTNNCEHFATRCKTGHAVSKQVGVGNVVGNCLNDPTAIASSASGAIQYLFGFNPGPSMNIVSSASNVSSNRANIRRTQEKRKCCPGRCTIM